MKDSIARRVNSLARGEGQILVATADSEGMPHLAAAKKLEILADGRVAVSAWFCPSTVANLNANRRLSVVIWDPEVDAGFQLIGEVEDVSEVAMMDGFIPAEGREAPLPQVERRLVMAVEKSLAFRLRPHTDMEEEETASAVPALGAVLR
jgi:hypothetical protein